MAAPRISSYVRLKSNAPWAISNMVRCFPANLEKPVMVGLPVKRKVWTFQKGPFVHSKAKDQFERRTYSALVGIPGGQSLSSNLRFLLAMRRSASMFGVAMRVTSSSSYGSLKEKAPSLPAAVLEKKFVCYDEVIGGSCKAPRGTCDFAHSGEEGWCNEQARALAEWQASQLAQAGKEEEAKAMQARAAHYAKQAQRVVEGDLVSISSDDDGQLHEQQGNAEEWNLAIDEDNNEWWFNEVTGESRPEAPSFVDPIEFRREMAQSVLDELAADLDNASDSSDSDNDSDSDVEPR
ncbi:unnamed protein product [Chrysoparadoxa australica]